jgi:hypothetical protein
MQNIDKPFEIASVSKADLLGLEKQLPNGEVVPMFKKSDIRKLTNSDMERLADKLNNDYKDQLFWSSLEIIAESIIDSKNKEQSKKTNH